MKKAIITTAVLLFLEWFALDALGAHVQFSFQNAAAAGQTNRPMYLFPTGGPFTNGAGVIVTRDRVQGTTDGSGNLTISNVYGWTYRGELQGAFNNTTNYYNFPVTNGLIAAASYAGSPTNANGIISYSQAQSDARYLTSTNVGTIAASNSTDFVASNGGKGTNLTFDGSLVVTGHVSGTDSSFFIGSSGGVHTGAGISVPFGQLQFQMGAIGGVLMTSNRNLLEYVGAGDGFGNIERWPRGAWHDLPVGNLIKQTAADTISSYRNSGAPADIYQNAYGGSVAPTSGQQPRGENDIWANQYKPFIVLSTRAGDNSESALTGCSLSTITNGVLAFQTNGYTSYFTNRSISMAYSIENGWLTNHRSASGLLRWNTNRFPWLAANDTMATNLTTYLTTNGFESWALLYAHTYVPSPANWAGGSSGNSELDLDPAGNTGAMWEYPNGANPFGAVEIQPCMTFDTYHLDVSTFYMWGFRGMSIQDMTGATGSGYFDTMQREFSSAMLNPYYNPKQGNQILLDAQWNSWYPGPHGMILNYFMGGAGGPWPLKTANNANGLYVETGGASAEPAGSGAVGWMLSQIRPNSQFITNAHGYCRLIPGTDAAPFSSGMTYKDAKSYFDASAFFNLNVWLTKSSASYNYFTNANFGRCLTNADGGGSLTAIWQDNPRSPPVCISLGATNSIWKRFLADGSPLVLFVNEDGAVSTNLTVSWAQLGFPSNTFAIVTDATSNVVAGVYSNSFTATIPSAGTMLVKLAIPRTGVFYGGGQGLTNTPQTFVYSAATWSSLSGSFSGIAASEGGYGESIWFGTNTSFASLTLGAVPSGRGFTNFNLTVVAEGANGVVNSLFPISVATKSMSPAGAITSSQTDTNIILTHGQPTTKTIKITFPDDTGTRWIIFYWNWSLGFTNRSTSVPDYLDQLRITELP